MNKYQDIYKCLKFFFSLNLKKKNFNTKKKLLKIFYIKLNKSINCSFYHIKEFKILLEKKRIQN